MKKNILSIFVFLFISVSIFSQNTPEEIVPKDSSKSIKNWHISEDLGQIYPTTIDTTIANFQNTSTDHFLGIANAYCGNLGSPLESKIYFNRDEKSNFLFLKPYTAYYHSVSDYLFFNTKTPYSNLSYYSAGPSYGKEERFKTLFSVNVNPKFNIGFLVDYMYGRGIYLTQSTNHTIAGLFGSYTGKRYSLSAITSLNNFKNYENGGIKDDRYITNPKEMSGETGTFKPQNIEVNLAPNTQSQLKNRLLYLNHKYSLGFDKANIADSSKTNFIPVTTFTHSLKYESDAKRYYEKSITDFYENNYLDTLATNDTAYYQSFKNTFGISLNEEFNRFAHFGLTAFISNDLAKYKYLKDSLLNIRTESNTSIGGILAKQLGTRFKYEALGEICLFGYKTGDFEVSGNILGNIYLKKDTINISAKGFVKSTTPDFFLNFYESNHFRWNNNFENTYRTNLSGQLAIPTRRFYFTASVENITKYIYFNNLALPTQYNNNIQILSLNFKKDFVLGAFHLENQVIYQTSSNQNVMPLPDFCLYHNLYFIKKLFKVLTIQLGTDIHYNTAYYVPSYMPATGQFHTQDTKKIGDYPLVDVYANFHLKRMRFFLMYYHINYNISEPNYFSMPNYPINPGMMKIGLSWNFYD